MTGVLGQGTVVVDGQRTTVPTSAMFSPQVFGQQTTGVPNVTPTIPPYMASTLGGPQVGYGSVGGYGTAGNNDVVASIAAAHPWHPRVSPVVWAIAFLVGGVLLLQAVSWHDVVEGHVKAGPVHAAAEVGH